MSPDSARPATFAPSPRPAQAPPSSRSRAGGVTLADEIAPYLRATIDRVTVEVWRIRVRGVALRLLASKRKRRRAAGERR